MKQQEVSQFIIVPPLSRRDWIFKAREVFTDHLARQFPQYSFEVAPIAPVQEDEDFGIIPIMNFVTPDGDSFMCQPVERWVFREIADACRRFRAPDPRYPSAPS
jgi:hypothetical protein